MTQSKSEATTDSDEQVPILAQKWIQVFHAVPRINFPGTNVGFGFVLASAMFLVTVRSLAKPVFVALGWPADEHATDMAAASIASICHSSLLSTALIVAFLNHKFVPSEKLDQAPLWWQDFVDAILAFCTGYMCYDTAFNLVYLNWDSSLGRPVLGFSEYLFLGHHFATSSYMTSNRVIRAGYFSAMACMLLGEITNPLHNAWFITGYAKTIPEHVYGEKMQAFEAFIEAVFAPAYLAIRSFIAPVVFLYVTIDLLSKRGRANIPLALNLYWNFLIWAVVFGSYFEMVKTWEIVARVYLSNSTTPASSDGGEETQEL
jgi:hypothetical protein